MSRLTGDVLECIFRMIDDTATVWAVLPQVCKQWSNVRNRATMKEKLIRQCYPKYRYSISRHMCCAYFDAINEFRWLRSTVEQSIANVVALGRMNGVPFPFLWIAERFLKPINWKDMFECWKTPIAALEALKKHLKTIEECCTLILKPPLKAFWDDVKMPAFEMPYDHYVCWDKPQNAYRSILKAIGFTTIIASKITKTISDEMTTFLYGPDACRSCGSCGSCGFFRDIDAPLTFGSYTKNVNHKYCLCQSCSRHLFLLCQSSGINSVPGAYSNSLPAGIIFSVINDRNNENIFFLRVEEEEPIYFWQKDVWFPNVEILCQRQCIDLINPEGKQLKLSNHGLNYILRGDSYTVERFTEQIHNVYASYAGENITEYVEMEESVEELEDEECSSFSDNE